MQQRNIFGRILGFDFKFTNAGLSFHIPCNDWPETTKLLLFFVHFFPVELGALKRCYFLSFMYELSLSGLYTRSLVQARAQHVLVPCTL